ncbi:cilia- and flagella-associated protein 299 isoform X1 [Xiphophorus couchianus]|uniref:cilia- and flagella-associated protein 299 isoform X1 n=1 Tax=Xiphophorus couchianus TaxID=32473 RepID=UPI001016A284|nr:cilia- and flagella-associated protein 299 isoform X1 [Xiphophorus couchianus]
MEFNAAERFYDFLTNFKDYEDYLDSKITPTDLFYLKSRELARKLVEHSHKGMILSREEFEERKAAAEAAKAEQSSVFYSRSRPMTLASAGKELNDNFLKALAEREEANRSGKMTSVIFIRDYNTLGQEVSGYIDYAHRLKTQDFEPYFCGKKRLMPGPSDLCYYNWKTQTSTSNSSPNFEVIYDDPNGLLFKSKRDKTMLNPWSGSSGDSSGTLLQSDLYVHVVLYDRRWRCRCDDFKQTIPRGRRGQTGVTAGEFP